MRARSLIVLASLVALVACEETPAPVAPAPQTAPAPLFTASAAPAAPPVQGPPRADAKLLPRKLLFGNPDRLPPRISPDGKRILFIAPDEGVLNVWVGPATDPKAAKPVTHERARPIRTALWAETSEHVIYANDKGGDENFHVFVVDLKKGDQKDLTPFEGVRADIQGTFDRRPTALLAMMNRRDKKFMDPVLIDIKTGKIDVLGENTQGFEGYVADNDAKIRLAVKRQADGTKEVFSAGKKKDEWNSSMKIPYEDTSTTSPELFDRTNRTVYWSDSRGRDTSAVVAVDTATGGTRVLYEDPQSDVQGILLDRKRLVPVAVASNRERIEWHVLDKSVQADFDGLKRVADGDLSFVSASRDDRRWTVSFRKDDGPTLFYLWDRNEQKATLLYADRPELEGAKLSRMKPVVVKARDGLELVSYLSTPLAADVDQDGRPDMGPIPMVLLVHGGPWGRDTWGFNGLHQWLANRGYAVLSVNFRSSVGFGKRFLNAGDREWAGKMHDDLVDAVAWAVDKKVADPQKVAIMGGSYGGYATLVGLTFTPDLFACGVDIVGPSNLVTLLSTIPPYWTAGFEEFAHRIGDPRTESGKSFLMERSPLGRAELIKKPLLIGQGANDPRVKQAESDQIVGAMKAKGLPVTYVLYPDEGHGFARPENRLSFYAVAEVFLAQHLGGSYLPAGDDFRGSSITVPSGADQIYGLADALSGKR
jgi:dipeptidyl aminopeptidase/acylaminoacyl peptidase